MISVDSKHLVNYSEILMTKRGNASIVRISSSMQWVCSRRRYLFRYNSFFLLPKGWIGLIVGPTVATNIAVMLHGSFICTREAGCW